MITVKYKKHVLGLYTLGRLDVSETIDDAGARRSRTRVTIAGVGRRRSIERRIGSAPKRTQRKRAAGNERDRRRHKRTAGVSKINPFAI